jgi:hypothetical protein
MTPNLFRWAGYDVRTLLPADWQQQILGVAERHAERKVLISQHSTSREARSDFELPTYSVDGHTVQRELGWLRAFYETAFRDLAQQTTQEKVTVMSDLSHGCVLNVQRGESRYECHVDTNPIEGLLYATTHREGEGGELVVSNRGDVPSIAEVDADATVIEPKAGHLFFFDGRGHSHYVAPLRDARAVRVVVAMNFYVPSCPEASRPPDLNAHLAGANES